MNNDTSQVYLVIMDRGGIFGAYFDQAHAHNIAREIEGVVVELAVAADYRTEDMRVGLRHEQPSGRAIREALAKEQRRRGGRANG